MKRLTEQEMREFFINNGCQLLSGFIDTRSKVTFVCRCGITSNIKVKDFKRKKKCKHCGIKQRANKKRTPYETVKKIFADQGCVLLETNYDTNCFTLLNYKCSCGNISKISFSNFKQGHRCKKCSMPKGNKHMWWNPNREYVKQAESFRKRCYNILERSLKATGQIKHYKSSLELGYTGTLLREWIVNHENWKSVKDHKWHLDHIFPIQAFVDYGITDIKLINSLDNLRPILSVHNLRKQDKYDKDQFEQWLKIKGIYGHKKS